VEQHYEVEGSNTSKQEKINQKTYGIYWRKLMIELRQAGREATRKAVTSTRFQDLQLRTQRITSFTKINKFLSEQLITKADKHVIKA
jgi:hypothetical protein